MRTLYDVDDVVRGVVVKLLFNVKCFVGVGKLKSVGRIKNVATGEAVALWCTFMFAFGVLVSLLLSFACTK